MLCGNHKRVLGRSRLEFVRTACAYGVLALVAVVLTLVLRTVSLIWIHNLRPMRANPWFLLKGGLRMALFVAPIQSPMLVSHRALWKL